MSALISAISIARVLGNETLARLVLNRYQNYKPISTNQENDNRQLLGPQTACSRAT